jgi:hypothetical protein
MLGWDGRSARVRVRTLPDLASAEQPGLQRGGHVGALVGDEPLGLLELGLAHDGPRLHHRVDLVTRAIQAERARAGAAQRRRPAAQQARAE